MNELTPYNRACAVFLSTLDLPEYERAAAIDAACGPDSELRSEVLRLVSGDKAAQEHNFIGSSAFLDAVALVGYPIPKSGTMVGRFRIVEPIGSGGMGLIMKAQDDRLHRAVALKLLPAASTLSRESLLRLQREARAASFISHPNIVSVFDADFEDGWPHIAMEFVEGRTLREVMANGPVDERTVLDIASQVASALNSAHKADMVHRDIKPENIMVRDDGVVKVLDFGLAKIRQSLTQSEPQSEFDTRPGIVMGTTQYVSPEQILGENVGAGSDLFSLGVVLYELATGVRPFDRPTDGSVLNAILTQVPKPPRLLNRHISRGCNALIVRLLQKEPRFRFSGAEELLVCCKQISEKRTGWRLFLAPRVQFSWKKLWIGVALPPARTSRWMMASTLVAVFAVSGMYLWRQRSKASVTRLGYPPAPAQMKAVTFNDSDDRVTTAAMSPSGEMIAYSDRAGISVFWHDSGAVRLLATPPQFQPRRIGWYPDNKRLAVSGTFKDSDTSQTWQMSLDGAAPRLLLDDSAEAAISPDGSSMAFIRHHGTEIALAGADGGSPHKLAAADERQVYRFLIWSRSGRYVVDESASEGLSADSGAPIARSSSPLSELEAEQRWNYETLDVRSGKRLAHEANIRFDSGYLLEDGRLFYPDGTISKLEPSTRLMMVQTDTADGRFMGPPVLVQKTNGDRAAGLSSSLDGRLAALVLSRSTADTFVGTLRRSGVRIGEVTKITQITHHSFESYPHAWSPKDDAVLLENNNLGKDAIFEQRLDSSPAKLVARLPGDAALAEFTSDGKWILFLELNGTPSHVEAIFRVPAVGGIPEQVPTTGEIEEFHCPALAGQCVLREEIDKKYLVYYALDPIKGMGRELARTAWEPSLLGEWSLSPDGSTVAVAKHDGLRPGIRLIDLRMAPAKISEVPVEGVGALLGAVWDMNARGFFVESRTESDYRLLYVGRTGDAKPLRSSPTPIWAVPSHDGTKIAFPEVTFRSNVLLLDSSQR